MNPDRDPMLKKETILSFQDLERFVGKRVSVNQTYTPPSGKIEILSDLSHPRETGILKKDLNSPNHYIVEVYSRKEGYDRDQLETIISITPELFSARAPKLED